MTNSGKTKVYADSVEKRNVELQTIIDDLDDQLINSENKVKHLEKTLKTYLIGYEIMKELIEDLSSHGVRFDIRPTLCNITSKDFKNNNIDFLYSYIEKIDSSIRSISKSVKKKIDSLEKENGL